jgi:hypothetical protein
MKMSPICRHSGSIGEERKLPTRRIALQSEQTVSAGNERAVEEVSAAVVACSGFKIHRILIQRRKKEEEGRRCVEAFNAAAGPVGTTSARHADAISARYRITKISSLASTSFMSTPTISAGVSCHATLLAERANDAKFVMLHGGAEERTLRQTASLKDCGPGKLEREMKRPPTFKFTSPWLSASYLIWAAIMDPQSSKHVLQCRR